MEQTDKGKRIRSIILAAITMAAIGFVGVLGLRVYNGIEAKYEYRDAGIMHYEAGEYDLAAADFQASLEEPAFFAEPVDRDTRLYLSDSYFLAKNYPAAIEQYDILLQSEVEQVDYLNLQRTIAQGMIDFEAKNFEAALPAFEMGVESGHPECALYAGVCAVELEKEDAAIAYLTTYLSYDPNSTYACIQLADYYLIRERYDTCLAYIEQAKACESGEYAKQLAYVEYAYYFALKDYNRAYQLLSAYKETYPLSEELQKQYDFLYTRQTIEEIGAQGA